MNGTGETMRSQILVPLFGIVAGCTVAPGDASPGAFEAATKTRRPTLVTVVDPAGNPIPCATVTSWGEHAYSYVTDAAGVVAIYEPDLMGGEMTFAVEHPADPGVFKVIVPDPSDSSKTTELPYVAVFALSETPVVLQARGTVRADSDCTPPIDHAAFLTATGDVPAPGQMFTLLVTDRVTGRALPGAIVITPHRTYVTDSSGAAAIYETGLMNTHASIALAADGYMLAPASVDVVPGLTRTLSIEPDPDQIAVRLYRLNGPGIFRDRVLLGQSTSQGVNADMMSQDGPMTAVYRGNLYWTFGDTNHQRADHSNYRGSAASSSLTADPERWFPLTYVHQIDGREAAIAPTSEFDHAGALAWPGGLVGVPDAQGIERLYSTFGIIENAWDTVAIGVGRYNDTTHIFERKAWLDLAKPSRPGAHAFEVSDGMQSYLHYENLTRIPATEAGLLDQDGYQTFTALDADGNAARDATGRIRYAWKPQTAELTASNAASAGAARDELLSGHLREARSTAGAPHAIPIVASARDYDPYRKRYVEIITEEQNQFIARDATWYAEGDTPMGPWVYARRITGRGSRSIYNPTILPLQKNDGAQLFFAAVYSNSYVPVPPLPYYNYSVVMHMLDVSDLRTALPVPVYELSGSGAASHTLGTKAAVHPGMPAELPVPFFAYDRPAAGTLPAYLVGASCRPGHTLHVGAPPAFPQRYEPDFYVLPADTQDPPEDSVALYEYSLGFYPPYHVYAIDGAAPPGGFVKNPTPVARVLRNPAARVWFPVTSYLPDVIANAGDDVCASEPAPGAGADIVLDASASRSLRASITSYTWSWATDTITHGPASGARTTIHLPAGKHVVQLSMTTNDGHVATDRLVVDIAPTIDIAGIAADDGWIVGCAAGDTGCSLSATDTALVVGDTASNTEARSIVSFDTSVLPSTAAFVAVALRLTSSGQSGTPFSAIRVDGAAGGFSGDSALELADFAAPPPGGATQRDIGLLVASGTSYQATLTDVSSVNRTGKTQLRLHGATATNGDGRADAIHFYSQDSSIASRRPVLRVTYWLP